MTNALFARLVVAAVVTTGVAPGLAGESNPAQTVGFAVSSSNSAFAAALDRSEADGDAYVTVRGQSSDPYYGGGQAGDPYYGGGQPADPYYGGGPAVDPFQPGAIAFPPAGVDPFSPTPGSRPGGGQQTFGINGPQPYRYGWKEAIDFGFMSSESTSPDIGDFTWNEANFEKQWVQPTRAGGVFTFAPQYNARWIEGPSGPPGLPGSVHRIGVGMTLGTPVSSDGFALEVGFNPAIATDFNNSLTSDAWQFDGHVAAFWRTRPTWMWVLGVAYWDRVDDIFLPYAGAVWTPNDYFEARLLFPKAKLEWFLGTPHGVPTWVYATAEYHVESYEVGIESPGPATPDQTGMQVEDYRVMGGVRWETGWLETFAEAGIVFEREVEFSGTVPDFEVDQAFMGRVGVKF